MMVLDRKNCRIDEFKFSGKNSVEMHCRLSLTFEI